RKGLENSRLALNTPSDLSGTLPRQFFAPRCSTPFLGGPKSPEGFCRRVSDRCRAVVAPTVFVENSYGLGVTFRRRAAISAEDPPLVATAVIPWTIRHAPPSFLIVMAKRSRDSMFLPSTSEMSVTSYTIEASCLSAL